MQQKSGIETDLEAARMRQIGTELESIATRIASVVPNVSWHVEYPQSDAYAFSALLVFHFPTIDEDAAVIEVALPSHGSWAIDAIGSDARWLGDLRNLPEGINRAMTEEPESAAWILGLIADRLEDAVALHLRQLGSSLAPEEAAQDADGGGPIW